MFRAKFSPIIRSTCLYLQYPETHFSQDSRSLLGLPTSTAGPYLACQLLTADTYWPANFKRRPLLACQLQQPIFIGLPTSKADPYSPANFNSPFLLACQLQKPVIIGLPTSTAILIGLPTSIAGPYLASQLQKLILISLPTSTARPYLAF